MTFHYPEMHPQKAEHGQEEIQQALVDAAQLQGEITAGERWDSVRFGYADEVAVQWLPEATPENAPQVEALRDVAIALATFVQRAMKHYLSSLPDGVVQQVPPNP